MQRWGHFTPARNHYNSLFLRCIDLFSKNESIFAKKTQFCLSKTPQSNPYKGSTSPDAHFQPHLLQREKIQPDQDRSFKVLVTPHLEAVFLWHYHPEYEVVYIEGTDGNRHIGDHLERYESSDLALIGPYVPHLNFDYGANRDHTKVVIQWREDFMGTDFFQRPELADIKRLLALAQQGAVYFSGETKHRVGTLMKQLPEQGRFDQLISLLEVLRILALSAESYPIQAPSIVGEQDFRGQQRLKEIQQYVAQHYQEPIEMQTLATLAHLSEAAFCRFFKKNTGLTFTEYLNKYRIQAARQLLMTDHTVTEACYGSGFAHLSHFNKTFKTLTGENPSEFKKKHVAGFR